MRKTSPANSQKQFAGMVRRTLRKLYRTPGQATQLDTRLGKKHGRTDKSFPEHCATLMEPESEISENIY
jgi:hypothetical protein